ncbi:MAG: PEP-CTERM sorting domain-containing protein [Acidobacteriaceae bacterium]
MLHSKSPGFSLLACAGLAGGLLLASSTAMRADSPLDYTFLGVASGSIAGPTALSSSTFSNQDFSISFIEDPANVTGSAGYYLQSSISGTFAEGSTSETIADAYLEVNGNPNTGSGVYESVNLFDSTFATDMQIIYDPALLDYELMTTLAPTGSVTGQTIGNYSGVGYSLSNGGTLDITNLSSLNFSVTDVPTPTPEPGTLVLLALGLGAVVAMRRRLCW